MQMEPVGSQDGSTQVDPVNEALEMDPGKIEFDFLQEILLEQAANLSWLDDEKSLECEWAVFLDNLKPENPRDCTDLTKHGSPGETSRVSEWDMLLARLSQLETTVVEQILSHVDSDVLEGMLQYMHFRVLQGSHRENNQDNAPHDGQLGITPPLQQTDPDLVQDEPKTMQQGCFLRRDLPKQMDLDFSSSSAEFTMFDKCPPIMDWPRGGSHQSSLQKPVYCVWNETGESMHWDMLGSSAHQLQTSQEAILQAGQKFKQQEVKQTLSRKLSQQDKPDVDEVYKELSQTMESKVNSQDSNIVATIMDPEFCQKHLQQIESKLAEIPSQIASTLLTRAAQDMDSHVVHQLFRQIDKILLQVVPQEMILSSNSLNLHQPREDQLINYWNMPPGYSPPRADYFGYSGLNQLVLIAPHQHHLHSKHYQKDLQQNLGFPNDCRQTELEEMLWQRNESLDQQQLESSVTPNSQNNLFPYSDVLFESTGATPVDHFLRSQFLVDSRSSSTTINLRYPKQESISTVYPPVSWTLYTPPSCHPPLLVKSSQEYPIQLLDLPQDLPPVLTPGLPHGNRLLPWTSPGIELQNYMHTGLPWYQQQQVDMDLVNLIAPSINEGTTFQQVESRALHTLHQNMCLKVLQHISLMIEYNITQGNPLEIDSGLHLLDMFSMNHLHLNSLQPLQQETTMAHNCFHSKETWGVLDSDFPETTPQTEYSEFTDLHEDMDSSLDSMTDPSGTDNPQYYSIAEYIEDKMHHHFVEMGIDSFGDTIRHGTLFNEFEECPDRSKPDAVLSGYISRPRHHEEVAQVLEFMSLNDTQQEMSEQIIFNHFEPSLNDQPSSLNLLQQSQLVMSQQTAGDQVGRCIELYLDSECDGLGGGTGSNLPWILNQNEPQSSAAIVGNQVTHIIPPKDFMISDDHQFEEDDLLETESLPEQVPDLRGAGGLLSEGMYSTSIWASESHEFENSTLFQNGSELFEAFDQLQLPQLPSLPDPQIAGQVLPVQQANCMDRSPQSASVQILTQLRANDSSAAAAYPQPTQAVHFQQQNSELSRQEPQMKMSCERQDLANDNEGTTNPQGCMRLNDKEHLQEEDPNLEWGTAVFPRVKLISSSSNSCQKPPTLSQFHDPSRSVRQTIFGLLVLAGGLYLIENQDEIEQQSISAAEAAAAAWKWLGGYLLKMAKGEFDN